MIPGAKGHGMDVASNSIKNDLEKMKNEQK